jgi:hypothetical protein
MDYDYKWTRSEYCYDGSCVEVAVWKKSSFSSDGPDCVEVAGTDSEILVRDSKNPTGPVLRFTPSEWDAFVKGAKAGEFDLPQGI